MHGQNGRYLSGLEHRTFVQLTVPESQARSGLCPLGRIRKECLRCSERLANVVCCQLQLRFLLYGAHHVGGDSDEIK